jgi:hypothetical protein
MGQKTLAAFFTGFLPPGLAKPAAQGNRIAGREGWAAGLCGNHLNSNPAGHHQNSLKISPKSSLGQPVFDQKLLTKKIDRQQVCYLRPFLLDLGPQIFQASRLGISETLLAAVACQKEQGPHAPQIADNFLDRLQSADQHHFSLLLHSGFMTGPWPSPIGREPTTRRMQVAKIYPFPKASLDSADQEIKSSDILTQVPHLAGKEDLLSRS